MNIYHVESVKGMTQSLSGRVFTPYDAAYANIADYPWGCAYRPEARAWVAADGERLIVTLCANEPTIAARERAFGGAVCVDSCLEFFVNPCPRAGDVYLNIEVNLLGTMHIGAGASRDGRRVLDEMPGGVDCSVSRHEGGWWAVRYHLPYRLLEALAGAPVERVMRANFYTCDESIHPHFGVWNHVAAAQPDFHRPECFGRLEFA